MSEYPKPLSEHPELVELIVRTSPGRDLEIEAPFSRNEGPARGPIKESGVIFESNKKRYIFFRLDWVAELTATGWRLIEEPNSPDELEKYNRWIKGAESYLEKVYFNEDEDNRYHLDDPSCHFIIIHPLGDNLRKEDLI